MAETLEYDQLVTPAHIATSALSKDAMGHPAGNGGFTVHRNEGVELGLRARLLDGDAASVQSTMIAPGVYRFDPGAAPGEPLDSRKPRWVYDWSFNVDADDELGRNLNSLSYRIYLDGDPGIGTDFLDFDPLGASPVQVPFDIRCQIAFGNNQTGEGEGESAGGLDCPTSQIVQLRNNNNVMQNSCSFDCPRFETDALENFDPNQKGIYTIVLEASSGGVVVARTEILVLVGSGLLDLDLAGPAQLIEAQQGYYDVRLRNIAEAATDELIEVVFELDGAQGDPDLVSLDYCADSEAAGSAAACVQWLPLSLSADGPLLRGRFGPPDGFPIDDDYDATTFIRATFSEAGEYQVRAFAQEVDSGLALAMDEIAIVVAGIPFIVLNGFDSDTLSIEFSVDVVTVGLSGDAAGWNGLDPATLAAAIVTPEDKQLFLTTFFEFDALVLDLIEAWDQVQISGQSDQLDVAFGSGLFTLSYALDLGNTGATRIDAEWVGTGFFETLSAYPLEGPEVADFKLEFTVPYTQETGADYGAAVTTEVITSDKPLIRPFAPGIESGSWTIEPVAIDFAQGSYATGLSAVYRFNGDPMGTYSSGQVLNQVGDYEVVVSNDSNPGVMPDAQTTVRFTREPLAAGASGSIEVLARQMSLDGQGFVQGGQATLEVAVEFVTVSPSLELVLVFDGEGPDGIGPDGEAVCEALLVEASCDALLATLSFDNAFVEDVILFSGPVQLRADAPLGDWSLNFYLLAVDQNGDFDLVSAASYDVRVEADALFRDRFQPVL
jgi:hypothetical protein